MSLTVPVFGGEAGNRTITINLTKAGKNSLTVFPATEAKRLHVTDYEPVALQPADKKGIKRIETIRCILP